MLILRFKQIFLLFILSFYVATSYAQSELPTVIVIHGFMANSELHEEARSPVTRELRARGFPVHVADIPRVGSFETQLELLRQNIAEHVAKGKKVVLLGHSQGGLLARLLAHEEAKLANGLKIETVLTIGTPHRGTLPATVPGARRALELFRPLLPQELYEFQSAVLEMSPAEMRAFNLRVTDVPGVNYGSVTTVNTMTSMLNPLGPNDGLIYAKSSEYGIQILIDGKHGPGNHINHIINTVGESKPAETVGQAVGEFLLTVANDKLTDERVYRFSTVNMKSTLNCLMKSL
jgi:pimeloyl-ACP methyl ester carboxylesterase